MFQCAWFFHCFVIIHHPMIKEGVRKGDFDATFCHNKEKHSINIQDSMGLVELSPLTRLF